MLDLKACIVCLSTEVTVRDINSGRIREEYNLLTGLKGYKGDGIPEYMCIICLAFLRKYMKFRLKCQKAFYVLQEILHKNKKVTKEALEELNLKIININSELTILPVFFVKVHPLEGFQQEQEQIKQEDDIINVPVPENTNIPNKIQTVGNNDLQSNVAYNIIYINNNVSIEIQKESHDNTDLGETVVATDNINFDSSITTTTRETEEKPPTQYGSYHHNGLELFETKVEVPDIDNFENDDITTYDINNTNNCNEIPSANNTILDLNEPWTFVDGIGNNRVSVVKKKNKKKDALALLDNESFAKQIPISLKESKAVNEVLKKFRTGLYQCNVCEKAYNNENFFKIHIKMHEKFLHGTYCCEICSYYYKTDFLLKRHMSEKHMYKYECIKCPEVNFDRASAKRHYFLIHLRKEMDVYDDANCKNTQSKRKKLKKKLEVNKKKQPPKNEKPLPKDFLKYSPVKQEDQYKLIKDRQTSKNYLEKTFKCELCYVGFAKKFTYDNHMKKHDPAISGKLQCDMCKLYYNSLLAMYIHMKTTHLLRFTCQLCSYVTYSRSLARMHYNFHKKVTYKCPHCEKVFKKNTTRSTHIRFSHPSSSVICEFCGHSYISKIGLDRHKQLAHPNEKEVQSDETPQPNLYCAECGIQFRNDTAFTTHLGSSSKHASTNLAAKALQCVPFPKPYGRKKRGNSPNTQHGSDIVNYGTITSTTCDVCKMILLNDVQAVKHYEAEHPGTKCLKRYLCDFCGHTTRTYYNLLNHRRTHTHEKPYTCPHCDRRFNHLASRNRHLVVHTGEKRFQCEQCKKRFAQKNTMDLHIRVVHMKIPYLPWDKKYRQQRKQKKQAEIALSLHEHPHKIL